MAEKKKIKLKICIRHTDDGDGSNSISFYRSEKEAKEIITKERQEDDGEDFEEIDWDDTYENGNFEEKTLEFELVGDELQLLEDSLYLGNFG